MLNRRRELIANSQGENIPSGCLMYFKPKDEWNTTKPASVQDETGNFTFSLNWVGNASGVTNGIYRTEADNDVNITNICDYTLTDGFTIACRFNTNSLGAKFYINNLYPYQLAWIWGYNSNKLEFYNYKNDSYQGGNIPNDMFRPSVSHNMNDYSVHFVALSYNNNDGSCIFVFDDDVSTFTKTSGYQFHIAKTSNTNSRLKVSKSVGLGKFFVYPRGLTLDEINVLKGLSV